MASSTDSTVAVQLGYAAGSVSDKDVNTPCIDKLGGAPAWFDGKPPTDIDLKCSLCGRKRYHIAQIYTPLTLSHASRRQLSILGCNHPVCSRTERGWLVLRSQRGEGEGDAERDDASTTANTSGTTRPTTTTTTTTTATTAMPTFTVSTDWGAGSVDFGMPAPVVDDPNSGGALDDDIEALLQARDSTPTVPSVPKPSRPTTTTTTTTTTSTGAQESVGAGSDGSDSTHPDLRLFPSQYIVYDSEPAGAKDSSLKKEELSALESEVKQQGSEQPEGWAGEAYISGQEPKLERQFRKRLLRAPEQCLRYAWSGTPLRVSTHTTPGQREDEESGKGGTGVGNGSGSEPLPSIERCDYCGAPRVFEAQLVPTIVSYLGADEASLGDDHRMGGMEWGSVHIYSCVNSCTVRKNGGYAIEGLLVDPPIE